MGDKRVDNAEEDGQECDDDDDDDEKEGKRKWNENGKFASSSRYLSAKAKGERKGDAKEAKNNKHKNKNGWSYRRRAEGWLGW